MSGVVFPFERVPSKIFGKIFRPMAFVDFWSYRFKEWCEIAAIADTGADYTLLPRFYADDFGVNLKTQCRRKMTKGIGGGEWVFLYPKMKILFSGKRMVIPVGFVNRNDLPPILGRHKFLEKFKVTFYRHQTRFER
jgi:predicted aspartyl protease